MHRCTQNVVRMLVKPMRLLSLTAFLGAKRPVNCHDLWCCSSEAEEVVDYIAVDYI